jgi:putative transposase
MKRTISIRLEITSDQNRKLCDLRKYYHQVCNQIVPMVQENRCWNRFSLHHLVYSQVRKISPLGSQMVCNAIFSVCKAYRAKGIQPNEEIPLIRFQPNRSVHFDKRTYKIKGETLSLYTLEKRIKVKMRFGPFQKEYYSKGVPKEGELICKKGRWYFNLVLELQDPPIEENSKLLGVDLGENNVFALSNGKIVGGGKIRHKRDQFLAKRRRLQSNGSQSAKQLLKKISGREGRCMRQTNHELSKKIIQEALREKAGVIVLEDLTNIRKRIKGGKRQRTRLHRWGFNQLQTFIQYKAEANGLRVMYINPAYSSQECSLCGCLGVREKHLFRCMCGNQQHADLNASRNHCRFALGTPKATCAVNRTQVVACIS